MTLHFKYNPCWRSGDNQSVWSSAPEVSRWLWPGNSSFLEVASIVGNWWIVAFLCSVMSTVIFTRTPRSHLLHGFAEVSKLYEVSSQCYHLQQSYRLETISTQGHTISMTNNLDIGKTVRHTTLFYNVSFGSIKSYTLTTHLLPNEKGTSNKDKHLIFTIQAKVDAHLISLGYTNHSIGWFVFPRNSTIWCGLMHDICNSSFHIP